jgi:hypothetical protein
LIPATVLVLGRSCFAYTDLQSISFEINSRLARIESSACRTLSLKSFTIPRSVTFISNRAFYFDKLESLFVEAGNSVFVIENDLFINVVDHKLIYIFSRSSTLVIPGSIEILGSTCWPHQHKFDSVVFESPSRLRRIDSFEFSSNVVVLPRTVDCIPGKAFWRDEKITLSFEAENEPFAMDNDFLVDVLRHKLVFAFSDLTTIHVPSSIEIIGASCFSDCLTLRWLILEMDSKLKRIESKAFVRSSLNSIWIPRTVEFIDGSAFEAVPLHSITVDPGNAIFSMVDDFLIDIVHRTIIRNFSCSRIVRIPRWIENLGRYSFSYCSELAKVVFEAGSTLKRIESRAFREARSLIMTLPSTNLFIAPDAFPEGYEVVFADQ